MTRREDAEDGIVGTGHYPRPGDDDYKRRPVVPPPIADVVAPLGPNATAILEERRCSHLRSGDYFDNAGGCRVCPKQPSPRPTVANLLRDIAAGIRVLQTYGVEITEAQVMERASNIVTGLIGNFRIEEAE